MHQYPLVNYGSKKGLSLSPACYASAHTPIYPQARNVYFCRCRQPQVTTKFRCRISAQKWESWITVTLGPGEKGINSRLPGPKVTVIHDSYFWALIQPLNFVVTRGCEHRRKYVLGVWGYSWLCFCVMWDGERHLQDLRAKYEARRPPCSRLLFKFSETTLISQPWRGDEKMLACC